MDRKMLLSMLTDDMLLHMLEGCKIVQGGMVGVVEGKMLKTAAGKVDIQPSNIVSITPIKKGDCEECKKPCAKCKEPCAKCKELEKEIAKLKKAAEKPAPKAKPEEKKEDDK
jgi:hypothetical protein